MLQSVTDEGIVAAAPLTLLLRRYAETGRSDISDAVGQSLAAALDQCEIEPSGRNGADWLILFLEASGVSEDARLIAAARRLAASLMSAWPSSGEVGPAMRVIEACLAAAEFFGDEAVPARTVDELERVIGLAYTPGQGLSRSLSKTSDQSGGLIEHLAGVSALLTAYALTRRLPYSMLAEDLMQFARHSWWDDAVGRFRSTDRGTSNVAFLANCGAARVLCRLAALHSDAGYRQAAVIAAESDYARDACRTLQSLHDGYRGAGIDAAMYGLALIEYDALL
jgi:hypothetical protein